jgi:uncharacterized membrane protein (UPF0127 family)
MKTSPKPKTSLTKKDGRNWKILVTLSLIILLIALGLALFKFRQKDAPAPLSLNSSLAERADYITKLSFNDRLIIEKLYVINGESEKGTLGLSGIKNLDNSGMLFAYKDARQVRFWMKDMSISLDIIWLGCNGQILGWQPGAKPEDYPETYQSPKLNYVLEVPAGFINSHQLKLGDKLELNLSDSPKCSE